MRHSRSQRIYDNGDDAEVVKHAAEPFIVNGSISSPETHG